MFDRPFWVSAAVASDKRKNIVSIAILLLFCVYFVRLFQLQIIEYGLYENKSQTQAIKKVNVTPVRGMMYDRNGKLLVHNIASFSITLTPHEFKKESMPLLCELLSVDSSNIKETLAKYKSYSIFIPIKILRDADPEIVAKISEVLDKLHGIDIVVDSKRVYDFDCNMAHLLGYTREINEDQLKLHKHYKPGDMVGQNGIEQRYEDLLHGKDGVHFIAVDKFGQTIAQFAQGSKDLAANNGLTLNLSIDIELQELAEKLLSDKKGAVVAIDPNNGEILAFASKPDYDPRLFSGKVPTDIYNALRDDKANPLLQRALQSQYSPGSTWKMFVALAALQEGIITQNSTIVCNGGYKIGDRIVKCHGNCGVVSVRSALRSSCNTFFCDLCVKLGMERFEKYGTMFNFGKHTQVDLPYERKGLLPTRQLLQKREKNLKNFAGRLANYGIGQGEILVTPLQIATYIATIANSGTYYQPHVVRSMYNPVTDETSDASYDWKRIDIENKYFEIVKEGMWDVVNAGGTGHGVALAGLDVCGKTGTAENSAGADHSWFVCFAPKDKPQIAICVFVENAGFGATVAAPIARQLLQNFFGITPQEVVIKNEETHTAQGLHIAN